MRFTDKNVLILSPHPDDFEFSCGALSFKSAMVVCLSTTEEINEGITQEFEESCKMAGVKGKMFDFPLRRFSDFRQEILEALLSIDFDFDVVICPSHNDTHQDHEIVFKEALRAFKRVSVVSYFSIWNDYVLEPNLFVEVSEDDLNKKLNLIGCYKTQKHRHYASKEYIFGRASFFGGIAGVRYAEAFHIQKLIS